ncbi:MAG: transcription antitermination factor NusB [Waddliaceae bacterium]
MKGTNCLLNKKMPLPKQKFREILFLLLYSKDTSGADLETMVPFLKKELGVSRAAIEEAQDRLDLFSHEIESIDTLIAKHSTSYSFDRIPSLERNLLRIGVYELLFDHDIPPKVAISEAMRLAKKFGTQEAAKFVNAILDAILKDNTTDAT